MRLIDADLLDEVLDDKFEGCYALDVIYIQDDIIPNIPTVDAVPREQYESMESTCYKLQQALIKSNNKGWIPCSERLPDKGLRVLMQLNNAWQIVGWYDIEDSQWFELMYAEPVANDRVLAWMELPESFRGDSE